MIEFDYIFTYKVESNITNHIVQFEENRFVELF